jgi:hypothetical protein
MPQRTIELLDQLSALGFTDEDFRVVHHFDRDASIRSMRAYCERRVSFHEDRTNQRVRERLEIVLAAFTAGRFSQPVKAGVFQALCEAAVREVPK